MKINSNHSLLLLAVVAGIVATIPAAFAAEIRNRYNNSLDEREQIGIVSAAFGIADVCEDDNRNFDRQRFLDACGIP